MSQYKVASSSQVIVVENEMAKTATAQEAGFISFKLLLNTVDGLPFRRLIAVIV
jgi:hypothetical protein